MIRRLVNVPLSPLDSFVLDWEAALPKTLCGFALRADSQGPGRFLSRCPYAKSRIRTVNKIFIAWWSEKVLLVESYRANEMKSILVDSSYFVVPRREKFSVVGLRSRSLLLDMPSPSLSSRGGFLYRDRAGYRYWQRGNRITLSCIIAMITVAYDAAIVRAKLNKRPQTSAKARCVITYCCK